MGGLPEEFKGAKELISRLKAKSIVIMEREDILIDAGDVLKMLIEDRVELILSGHRHVSWIWEIEHTVIVHAGTVGSPRTRGMPNQNYSIIRIGEENISVGLKMIGEAEKKVRSIRRNLLDRSSELL